jgi:hypothetical protein
MQINSSANPHGRPRKASITLADLHECPRNGYGFDGDKVAHARLSIKLCADPLGITTGDYAKRPAWQIGEPSPERSKRARERETFFVEEAIELEETKALGVIRSTRAPKRTIGKRKRVVARLEVLHRAGKLEDEHIYVARRFQEAAMLGFMSSGGLCAKYGGAEIKGHEELLPIERMIDKSAEVYRSYQAVNHHHWFILNWIATEAYKDVSIICIGNRYFGHFRDDQTRRKHAVKLIVSVLTKLLSVFRLR